MFTINPIDPWAWESSPPSDIYFGYFHQSLELFKNNFINYRSNRGLISKIDIEFKKSEWKMKYKSRQRIFKRVNPNGGEIIEEMFNILGHQGNANKKSFEISSYTSWND